MSGTAISTQEQNSAMIALLMSIFQSRAEPNFNWKSIVAANLALPGLRGFWPMSGVGLGAASDMAGLGLHLSYFGNGTYNTDSLAPYFDADGTGDYLARADEALLDIVGTEFYMANPGLTIGGWFWVDTLVDFDAFFGKYAAGQFSYWLRQSTAANARVDFVVSVDGAATTRVSSTIGTLATGEWRFLVGRFTPSTELALFDTGTWYTNVAAIPASIHSGTADLAVCAGSGGVNTMDGRASMCLLCASAVPTSVIEALYNQTKIMFNRF